ncbi:PDZ domain-containing protein [candidate division KSB1 bacterium]|nr:PDZ domain-containing protein [candidate division KSB1 bacterium]
MKLIYKLSFLVLLTGFSLQTSNAQVRMQRRIEGGDGAFHLKEVQTILTSKDDTIKVMMVLPERLRPQGYGDIVLKENDEILMVNAQRVKTVQEFEELYNALEIGGTLKMGIRRKGELMIESFKKIDPEDMPEGANIMIQTAMPGEEEGHEGGMMRTFTMDGGDSEEMRPWFGTGLILGEEEGTLKVMRIMEGMTGALGKADIKEGDEIKSLNGQKVETLDKFFEMYEKLDTGSKVEIEYARAGKKMQAAFEKPNMQGRMMMRRN